MCLCVCTSCRVSNKQTDKTNGQINELGHLQTSFIFPLLQISEAMICGDGEETWADVLRYHDGVLLIDEDSDQRSLPATLFLVQVSSRQQTEVMDVRFLIN